MTDLFPPEKRSDIMRNVLSRDSKAEMAIRRIVHSMGYRYRLHHRELPGRPDLVFPSRQKVIFVHGCFWHGHNCPAGQNKPKSRVNYWEPKLKRNIERDKENQSDLLQMGWNVVIIWECDLRDLELLESRIKEFMEEVS